MVRRIGTFLVFILMIAAVTSLVYFNAQETSFRLTPERTFTLPLGILMLAAAVAGAVSMFLIALMREGRHALRDWRVHRELRAAQRNVEYVTEARSVTLAGDYKRARALLTKATQKRAPELADVVDYAETFLLEDDPVQARRVLEEGQKDFGNQPLLLFTLARACRAGGDGAVAISALDRALAAYPKSLPMLTMLRDMLFEAEEWQRAETIQRRIVELRPDDASERNWLLGARYEAASRSSGAERDSALKGIAGDAPDFVPAILERARLLSEAGDARRAVKMLEKAVKRKPRGALLDELERAASDDDSARLSKLYGKLVTSNPAHAGLKLRAAHYMVTSGHVDEAADMLSSLSDNGQPPVAHVLWGEIHAARQDSESAQGEYRKAFAKGVHPIAEFSCEVCDARGPGWQARCDNCGAWGMFESL